jgi:MOSC domain-containing protein YiiM
MEAGRMATIVAVARDEGHRFSKPLLPTIHLLAGLGVEGDAHCGTTVKHGSRVAVDPTQPNLRQVHLIHAELFEELAGKGFSLRPGDMGENVTTRGIDLRLGAEALIEITGLRNPCVQIEAFQPGLLKAVVGRDADGNLIRKAGIMGIVLEGGEVRPGDPIDVTLPALPHRALERV